MEGIRKVDKRDNLRVVTSNEFIILEDLAQLTLNARKLLYIAVAQCRMGDDSFYNYEITPAELAEMWGIDKSHVYGYSKKAGIELMKIVVRQEDGKNYKLRHIFESCEYQDDGYLRFKLHKDMTDMLLGVDKSFSKPRMWDFMRMKSGYSMAIWHLMQREMKSFKPMMSAPIEFDLTIEELRKVTGTENKLRQMSEFKARVLNKAIQEIERNCLVKVNYQNIKKGRTVVGFRFTATSYLGTVQPEELSLRMRQRARRAELVRKKAEGKITDAEQDELQQLNVATIKRQA